MAKKTYQEIMTQKNFSRNAYRRSATALMVSCVIMMILTFAIYYLVIVESDPAYYASQSAGFLTPLRAMSEPNASNQGLLAPDPPEEMTEVRELQV